MNNHQLDIEQLKVKKLIIVTLLCIIFGTIGALINQIFVIKTSLINLVLTIGNVLIPPIIFIFLLFNNKTFFIIKKIAVYYVIYFVFFIAIIGGGVRSISNNILFIIPFLAYSFNAKIKISSILVLCGYSILVIIWKIPILDKWFMQFNTYPNDALLNPTITYVLLYYIIFIAFTMVSLQYDKENKKYKKLLAEEIKKKIDFFVNLAHETKTPLTLTKNKFDEYVKSLKHKLTPELKEIGFYINKLCNDIVNLLDISNIERGRVIYNHNISTNISKLLNQQITLFNSLANKKHINLTLSCEDSLFLKIDPTAFERIVNNLLENAFKYIGNGHKITVTLKADKTFIYLSIADDGMGISKEQQENIFEPYYQISRKKSNIQGLGLGLSIVKHIVDSISGNINLISETNKGMKIIITLLKHTLTENDIISNYELEENIPLIDNSKLAPESYNENKYTVLYVEDHIDLVKTMQKRMSEYFNFYYAINGLAALKKLEDIPTPDIIIADIMMDVMDGHEFYAKLKEQVEYKDIPVIFLTARTIQKEKEESLVKGIIDYVYKPFHIDELIQKILVLLKYRQTLIAKERKDIEAKFISLLYSKKDLKSIKFQLKCKKFELSPREKEIAELILKGKLYKEIAYELKIKKTTVSKHIRVIYKKCGVHSNIELVILFME